MAYVRQLEVKRGRGGKGVGPGTVIAKGSSDVPNNIWKG